MYHYGFRPQEYYTIMYLQPNPPVPYTFGPYSEMNNFFPSIQMHNFTSRPYAFAGDPYHSQNGHVEYHHFYGANPLYSSPAWYYPSYNTMPAYSPWMNYNNSHSHQRANTIVWPEGFTMKGELLWGRMDRIFGVKRDLPEFVKEDLRRVYGTYPRTFVAITYQNGEYLVKADPKVGEQEYTVEKKVIRRQPTPSDSEDDISDNRNSKKKRRKPRR
ncbi:uncharacterized protein C10orf95 homolog [Hyla sarda]|uniref:uncharacterized protein C10orf95 homolog n=1 Tax=Hyla sarda TaxID=327740 RepID=UPI0024C20DB4|nr:uncharacterized protein C10orf95 homolog [Hyla sarda]XP_056385678.1 uncharacterized protein C10orf95 homolog [Hyla sarda]XP_056385679.1 uncharacterized protein C10orf95 homolog [Hyla sarda]